jgi:2-polyprenyl-3-methyl-5-hydroxy-6-metoxy-1,4-benzoquinol methylase
MPIGSYSSFRDIMRQVLMHSPKTILDLGVGHGINGAGIRNWLNVGIKGNYKDTIVIGVEGFREYHSPLWACYDMVYVSTIQQYLEHEDKQFDCVLMTDVLEHFDKDEGNAVISKIVRDVLAPGGILLISTPAVWIEQGAAYGNELETHRSLWHFTDFIGMQGVEIIKDGREDDMGYKMLVVKITKI